MDLQLANKTILVTGGASGIGYGICRELVSEGAIPLIVDRDKAAAEQLVKTIKSEGGEAGYAMAELTSPQECEAAVRELMARWGKIEGLVNNAGVNDGVGLEKGDYDKFMASLQKNLAHYYLMGQLVLPELKKCKGPIVNISSKVAVTGQGGTSGYAAATGGRNALTREWALELLPFGIRVNAVVVAECFTPLYEKWVSKFDDPEAKLEAIARRIPLGNRMTTPAEIAATVTFLLSPRSGHTTGQLIYVDGGYTHLDRALT